MLVFLWRNGSVDNTRKAHPKIDADAVIYYVIDRLLVIRVVEICQETQRA